MQKRLTAPLRALLTRAAAAAAAATLTLGLLLFAAPAQAGFTPPNGDWREEVEEYRVKVLGGWIRVQRDYVFDRWQINARWNPLGFEKDALDGSIKRILRNEAAFEQQGDAWAFGKRALIRKQSITLLPPGSGEGTANGSPAGGLALQSAPGYRWLDRDGNWIDYDLEGKAVAYGDRNDLHVWLEYGQTGSADANRIVKIRDHHGRTVLTYRYSGDQLVEVRETNLDGSAGRSLALTWNGNLLTQVSDVLGNKTGYTYENNKLKTETDPEGRTRTLTYGPTGRIQKVTEPDGGETLYQYDYDKLKRTFYLRADGPATPAGTPVEETWFDADGRLIRRDLNGKTISGLIQDSANKTQTSSDARGQSTVTTLDDYDNPVRIQYPDGAETRASYSPIHGQVTDETDELGIKTHYDYDAVGNLLKKTEAVGLPEQRITDYTRDAYGQVLSETRRGGSVTLPDGSSVSIPDATRSSQWDSRGNLVQQANEVGAVLATRYDGAGRPLTITDPLNHDWTYVWDAKGRLSRLTDPLNHSLNHSYDKAGNRISSQDAEGHSTTYGYDGKNRLTRITNALGQAQTLAYDAQGRLVRRQDETGATLQTLTYDPDGRLAADTDGNNNLTAYTYPDNSSLPSQITYPTFSRKLTWDARNRNSQTQDQLDSSTAYSTTQAYDKRGNLTQITDRNGKPTTLAYDALGRLIQVTDPAGGLTKYAYDPWDNLLAVQDPKGNTTKYAYDLAGRRTKETRPLGGSQTWSYDLAGNLTQTQDPKGNRISYVYDDARRRVGESHLPAGQTSPSRGISYRYNNANALTGYDDSQNGQLASSASYTLDALNRKTAETITINGKSYAFQTAYTPSGQLARLTWPDAYSVQYSYDQNQNYAGLTLPEGSLSTQQQRWNQPTQTLLPGGTRLNRDYDPLMRLTRSQATSGGGAALMDRGLAYDPESNITQKATEYGNHSYQYDALYRLTQASNPTLGQEQYSYDPVGNRLTDSRTNGLFSTNTWTYDADNKLTQGYSQTAAAINYSWDENGSLTQQSSSDPQHNQRYSYDASNRLTQVQDKDGNPVAGYVYDPYGRRIGKTLYQLNGQALATPQTTSYLYSDQGLIAEADDSGNITRRYGWRPDAPWGTDAVFQSARRSTADPASALETFYALNDHLGATQKLIDQAGNVVWEGRATAFGETQVQQNNQVENNTRFPGQYFDLETNTHYNYFRDYDPSTGRYRERDPIGLYGGLNAFAYVDNIPLNDFDPYGLFDWSDMPVLPQEFVDFSAGAGDVLTFGITKHVRAVMDIESVNVCSDQYTYGTWAGIVASIATGYVGGAKAVARASSGINWSHFSHSAVPHRVLRKLENPLAKWLDRVGNRLNGDFISPSLHRLIDPVANRVGRTVAERLANPPYSLFRQAINRIPYTPGAAAYGSASKGVNNYLDECRCK